MGYLVVPECRVSRDEHAARYTPQSRPSNEKDPRRAVLEVHLCELGRRGLPESAAHQELAPRAGWRCIPSPVAWKPGELAHMPSLSVIPYCRHFSAAVAQPFTSQRKCFVARLSLRAWRASARSAVQSGPYRRELLLLRNHRLVRYASEARPRGILISSSFHTTSRGYATYSDDI